MPAKLCGLLRNVLQDKKVIDEPKAKVMAKALAQQMHLSFATETSRKVFECVCVWVTANKKMGLKAFQCTLKAQLNIHIYKPESNNSAIEKQPVQLTAI